MKKNDHKIKNQKSKIKIKVEIYLQKNSEIKNQLNTLGLLCPEPIIETAKRIKKIKKGQVLEILSDDWGMKTDLPAWCKSTGHILIEIKEEKNYLKCQVKK